MTAPLTMGPSGRVAWLDIARGVALVAMAIYHFTWDLALFGVIDPATPFELPWRLFARVIAGSFLVLVGIGLVLAHQGGVRWRSFGRRLATILLAAGAITLATYVATPDAFIFFGILHMIAAGSVAGILLVNAPLGIVVVVGTLAALVGFTVSTPVFDVPALWWTGLGTVPVRSNDLVPFFPSFAAVCAGIVLARTAYSRFRGSSGERVSSKLALLAFLGRHSLLVYLLHQPILIGLLWLVLRLLGRV